MSFTKLEDRIEGLPLVLAGPIVRRVEPGSITVWVALRRRRGVRLEIYDGPTDQVVLAVGERDTLEVGANLHIACVTAKPSAAFADGKTYQYNLFFDQFGTPDDIPSGASLFDPRIIAPSAADARTRLTYASDGGPTRPSFVLPPTDLNVLRLLHGSCRLIGGDNSDALEAADHILREAFKTNGRRPHMLFLTGDNIYNDDCEKECFEVILDAAEVLLGWDESMPGANKRLSEMSGPRYAYSFDYAGLSSGGHFPDLRPLFGLGETIALFLLSFADVLWPDDLDYQSGTFQFRGTLPAVRRALANMATYMIFDDHEFVNSWNLTADWVESVLARPMGRRVYQNALAAYALCQGWGNTPDRYESGAGKALFDAVEAWSTAERAGTSSPPEHLDQISKSLGLPDHAAFRAVRDWSDFHGPDVVRWDYTVPCPHLDIAVLDTYMWRSYANAVANPVIITGKGLSEQIGNELLPDKECSLIVVSNVAITLPGRGRGEIRLEVGVGWYLLLLVCARFWPVGLFVLLVSLIVRMWGPIPTMRNLVRAFNYRNEHGDEYAHQTEGFELLMALAAHRAPRPLGSGKRQARVVFLSGDIHHSFCMRMEYWSSVPFGVEYWSSVPNGVTEGPVEGVLAQLVSSPCTQRNPKFEALKDTRVHHWAGWNNKPELDWKGAEPSPWRCTRPWMIEYVPEAGWPVMTPPPQWRYSLQPVTPKMPPQDPLDIPNRPTPVTAEMIEEMRFIEEKLLLDCQTSEDLVINNLGDVTFDWSPSKKTINHDVWWRVREQNWVVTRFVVKMDPPPSPPLLPQ